MPYCVLPALVYNVTKAGVVQFRSSQQPHIKGPWKDKSLHLSVWARRIREVTLLRALCSFKLGGDAMPEQIRISIPASLELTQDQIRQLRYRFTDLLVEIASGARAEAAHAPERMDDANAKAPAIFLIEHEWVDE